MAEAAKQLKAIERKATTRETSQFTSVLAMAECLGCSKKTILARIHAGEIPAVREGNRLLVKQQDWENYLKTLPKA